MKWISSKQKRSIFKVGLICLLATIIFVGAKRILTSETLEKIQASSIVTNGDFRMTANNKWDNSSRTNHAELEWDEIANLTQTGYRLFQSEDQGLTWTNQSLNYGKSIKVLNVYPDREASNTLKTWMDGLGLQSEDGTNLIQVTPITITEYNSDSEACLKNSAGDYLYDVIMFGSWDANDYKILEQDAYNSTRDFLDSGRGVLFGHDTLAENNTSKPRGTDYFLEFHDDLGLGVPDNLKTNNNSWQVASSGWTGSTEVSVINDGYLMKYPFEMENELILDIPYSHSVELSDKSVGVIWSEFINPSTPFPNTPYEDDVWRGGWYLKTNNNLAMIQTGHSNGNSTEDERKIIANVLYNLAQVSLDNDASDYSVIDDEAPDAPSIDIRCGDSGNLNIRLDAQDNGKIYQWYVEADTKDRGLLQSDTVQEEISSNIAGYFYRVTDTPTTPDFKTEVENKKDSFGRISESQFDLYVSPNDNSVSYPTVSSFTTNEERDSEKYVQVIAVDRMSNVSEVTTVQIKDLVQNVDFEVERTSDEAKLVDVVLDNELDQAMETLEIQVPKHVAIKDFNSLTLPNTWASSLDATPSSYQSYYFTIKDNNSVIVITDFLDSLVFSISTPVNQTGTIKMIFHPVENEESLNDLCWNANIPQKILLTAYDEDNTALPSSDILYDQQLRIGQTITVTPTNMDFYEFLELRETDDTPRGTSYTVSDTYQEGKIIYSLRKAIFHVRQVVLDSSNEIVVPTEGYVKIQNRLFVDNWTEPTLVSDYQANLISSSGRLGDNPIFTDIVVRTNHLSHVMDVIQLSVVVPEFYQYLGYYFTSEVMDPDGVSHIGQAGYDMGDLWIPRMEIDDFNEFWITLYIKPNVDENDTIKTPQPYSWDYKKNDLGKIKTITP